jgi:hypothetical protein
LAILFFYICHLNDQVNQDFIFSEFNYLSVLTLNNKLPIFVVYLP